MKKNEKNRVDLDLDFLVGFISGVIANLIGSYLWEKIKEQQKATKLNDYRNIIEQ